MKAYLANTNSGLYVYIDNETIAEFSPSGRAVPVILDGVLYLNRWETKTKKGSFGFSSNGAGWFYGRVGEQLSIQAFGKSPFALNLTEKGVSIPLAITDPTVLRPTRNRGKKPVDTTIVNEEDIQIAVNVLNDLDPEIYHILLDTHSKKIIVRKEKLFK